MKILYAAENRIGAGIQAYRIANKLKAEGHDVKIAAYVSAYDFLPHIDWCLNTLILDKHHPYSKLGIGGAPFFGFKGTPAVNKENARLFVENIELWKPDLVINDVDIAVAYIANFVGVKMWYCSPLFLENAVNWVYKKRKFKNHLEKTKLFLDSLPEADESFVYSPFGATINKNWGYKFITPYFKNAAQDKEGTYENFEHLAIVGDKSRRKFLEFNLKQINFDYYFPNKENLEFNKVANYYFLDGNSSFLADCLFNSANFCISPKTSEEMLNADVCSEYFDTKIFEEYELEEKFKNKTISELKEEIVNKKNYNFNKYRIRYLHQELLKENA